MGTAIPGFKSFEFCGMGYLKSKDYSVKMRDKNRLRYAINADLAFNILSNLSGRLMLGFDKNHGNHIKKIL